MKKIPILITIAVTILIFLYQYETSYQREINPNFCYTVKPFNLNQTEIQSCLVTQKQAPLIILIIIPIISGILWYFFVSRPVYDWYLERKNKK